MDGTRRRPRELPVAVSRSAVLASRAMRLLQSLLLLCLLVSLPVNSIMAVSMPLCLPDGERSVGVEAMHGHASGGWADSHTQTLTFDACQLACEKCSICAMAALASPLALQALPRAAVQPLSTVARLPSSTPAPPFRPPLSLL